jgi:hypothetical protein
MPPDLERRRSQRRAFPRTSAMPATPADYQKWLAERKALQGLLLEAGHVPQRYGQDGSREVIFESTNATRQKLDRVLRLIAEYEAARGSAEE